MPRPTSRRRRHGSRRRGKKPTLVWVRYRGWSVAVGVLLIALGLANIYPFLWMLGTSFKSTSEAARKRETPMPGPKFRLTEAGRALLPRGLNTRQCRLLADLQTATERGRGSTEVSSGTYAVAYNATPSVAAAELRRLAVTGVLVSMPRSHGFRLAPDLATGSRTDLNARQVMVLRIMADEDDKRRKGVDTFVAYRVTPEEYADTTGLYVDQAKTLPDGKTVRRRKHDVETAWRELATLRGRGLVRSSAFQWENYWIVFKDMKFYVKLLTSLILTAGVVMIGVTITSMFGYALARLQFPGKMWVLGVLLVGAVAPREAVIIPIFRMLQGAGLLSGLWGMVLWMGGLGIGNSFLMAGYFMTLPSSIEEAAKVDGAGPFRTFLDISLPMARPIVMTIGLFAFLSAWNNFMIPLLCTQAQPAMQPLAMAVYSVQQARTGFWGLTNAAAAIMVFPVILLFLVLQKHIVEAIAVGAVKG